MARMRTGHRGARSGGGWPVGLGLAAIGTLAILLGVAPQARGHGPTIRVSYSGVRPKQLAIPAGTTVHFKNANSGPGACTVVADDGSFTSPPITRSEGWHYEFAEPGSYSFHVKEYDSARGVVLVGPREAE